MLQAHLVLLMKSSRSVILLVLLLAEVVLTLPTPDPARVRFPDEREGGPDYDDGFDDTRGRILLPPLRQPERSDFLRRPNNNNNSPYQIPREPLTLAEPQQSLNAWQFYYPPGPAPPGGPPGDTASDDSFSSQSQQDFDAAASNQQSSEVRVDEGEDPESSESEQPETVSKPEIINEAITTSPRAPLTASTNNALFSSSPSQQQGSQILVQLPFPAQKPIDVRDQQSNIFNAAAVAGVSPVYKPSNIAPNAYIPAAVIDFNKEFSQMKDAENESVDIRVESSISQTSSALKKEDGLIFTEKVKGENPSALLNNNAGGTQVLASPSSPPDFKPQFEGGGWTPLDSASVVG